MQRLLEEPSYADFEMRVNEASGTSIKIPIHRSIFAASSPVFAAMFELDMAEKKNGFVNMEGFSVESLRGLRAFLYTGKLEFGTCLEEYLELAERYDIKELKKVAGKELFDGLFKTNLFETAILADKYRFPDVMEACQSLIKDDKGQLAVPKPEWDEFKKANPAVALSLSDPWP